ncbi:related to mitochondrial acidic matrix protein [Rhynchosporium secalis]|uniref:Related to mitochondrial acidic matrix protein n=1 Tax=Rhynchosporium secalis TaxID=38038 RepID=A0A1E1MK06_RHYSE|nr:related to mitochondrial acidic matrix protein [Rhynchosporium secalis]
MLSLRSFARAAPRTVFRLTSSCRQARPSSLLQSAWKQPLRCSTASFSTSISRKATTSGESDVELAEKLSSEIQMENDLKEEGGVPTSVKDYIENGPFEVIDTPGQEEVVLTRTFGDEKISITFSIADLNAMGPEADYQDPAMADESDENGGAAQAATEENSENEEDPSFPARLNIVVEKQNRGALSVEAVVQDGMVVIDNVYYYTNPAHAHAKSADMVHERQDLYVGPPFGNLDEDLQVLMEKYLDERGVNTALAIFVPDYIDMKEQKEYVRWLENVKGFVEA